MRIRLNSMNNRKKGGLLVIVGLFFIFFSMYRIVRISSVYDKGIKEYTFIRENYTSRLSRTEIGSGGSNESPDSWKDMQIDFKGLQIINEEVVAWIDVEGTDISYPVVHTHNDNKYLDETFDNKQNACGAIFLETQNSSDLSDNYNIIYGHNMKNGSMFGALSEYKRHGEDDFYNEHKYFSIYTPEKKLRYLIVAYFDDMENSEIYSIGFNADNSFKDFINAQRKKSYIDTGEILTEQDKIVVLSTCSSQEQRFVVMGKLIEEECGSTE